MLLVRNRWDTTNRISEVGFRMPNECAAAPEIRHPTSEIQLSYRLRWPWAARLIFFFIDPRATPEARLALGAAFLRAVRFSFFRSVRSVTVFVFISLFSVLRIFRSAS